MLASLIRLRQSQSANKDSNCDGEGDMREMDNYCLLRGGNAFLSIFFHSLPAHKYKPIYASIYTRTQVDWHTCTRINTHSHAYECRRTHSRARARTHALARKTGHHSKSKSNCHESHCHRGNSGQLHAEQILSDLRLFSLRHAEITDFQSQQFLH